MEEAHSLTEAKADFRSFLDEVPDVNFVVKRIVDTVDGGAVAEWQMTGTKVGGNGTFRFDGVDVFRMVQGSIGSGRAYLNPSTISS